MENLKQVKACPLFVGLSEAERRLALELFSARSASYKKGEFLRAEGDPMPFFGLVLSGTVQVFMNDLSGDSIMMASVPAGGTFGESLCFLNTKELPVYILAAEDSSVLWLSLERLQNSLSSSFEKTLYNRFIASLAQRSLDMNDRIQVLSKLTTREKILTLFSQTSRKSGSRTFSLPLNREQLASYLGVNRSALSRELCRMRDEGLIEFYKNSFKVL